MKFARKRFSQTGVFSLLTATLFIALEANAQYGNEWINYNHEYFRIPVAQDGLYRITYAQLQQAGFPVASVDPRRLQLFHRGVEQAIHVEGQEDAQFNPADYVEFYGRRNDGVPDTELYQPASAQPHTYYNLYSDTTVYFLTYSTLAVPGKRMQKTWEVNVTNLPQEASHKNERLLVLTQEHSNGTAYNSFVRNTSFDVGEAWTGQFVVQNSVIDYTLDGLTNTVSSGGVPLLEVLIQGRSDIENHRCELYVGPNPSALRLVATEDLERFNFTKVSSLLDWTDIGADGRVMVRLRVLATAATARASIAFIRVVYPQSFDAASSTEKYFWLAENPSGKSYISISNPSTGSLLYDVTDPANVVWYQPPASSLNPVISNTDVLRKLFLTSTVRIPAAIRKVAFRNVVPPQHNYLIISHPLLMKPAAGHADVVKAYAGYRASQAGGAYDTLVVDVQQLYYQFNYGEISPLAIHRFMRYMLDGGSPKYLFIIGKGMDWFYNYHRNPSAPSFNVFKDLVPSAGAPASDMYYTIGLGGTTYEPAVPTGRISATSPAQVASYLNKVMEMEGLPFDNLWRKHLVHLSGGITEVEKVSFEWYLQGYAGIAEDVYLGGKVKTQTKNTTSIGELINISEEVNKGINLITMFGHSSATSSDFEVGYVSNPSLGYNNPGKYPVFLINGCAAGDFFVPAFRFGEDWILSANRGATGLIAHTSTGYNFPQRYYSDLFYRLAYSDSVFMMKGIGDIQKEVAKRYMVLNLPTEMNLAQISQMFLLGDPALKLFPASHPDYEVNNTSIYHQSLDGEPITAYSESFAVNVIVQNFGRALRDSLQVMVTRIFNDGSSEAYDSIFRPVFYKDTLTFIIHQEPGKGFGNNTFHIEIDPGNEREELREDNNTASYDLFVPLNITRNLLPYDFSIVNTSPATFIFSSTDLAGAARDFELEIDTVHTFTSPFLMKFVVNGILAEKEFQLLAQDSLVYYWRTRFKEPQFGEIADWVMSSFAYIDDSPEGWAQIHFPQYLKNEVVGLVRDPELRLLEFTGSETTLDIFTIGSANPLPFGNVSVKINNEEFNPDGILRKCRNNTINLIAFDRQTATPYAALALNPFDVRVCGKRPNVINSFQSLELGSATDGIADYMNNLAVGDSVVLFTIGNPGAAAWAEAIKLHFESVGISAAQLASVLPGEPVVIYAKKGSAIGSAIIFRSAEEPANAQELLVNGTITGRVFSGMMQPARIGPAQDWQTLITQVDVSELPQTDEYGFDVTGITLNGTSELLLENVEGVIDLSFIDAAAYPYLSVSYHTSDPFNLTPSQLKKWLVHYTPVPEGVLMFERPPANPSVKEGQDWQGAFGFKNISQKLFSDSLTVRYEVHNQPTRTKEVSTVKIPAPLPGEITSFDLTIGTLQRTGLNDLEVFVNPRIIPEQYFENNQLVLNSYLTVEADVFNPVLDVTVDGRYLVNGDFVAPSPKIVVRLWDENQFIRKIDPDGVNIRLTWPGAQFPTIIDFEREDVQWFAQTDEDYFRVEFSPQNLPEGKYILEAEGRDGRNNTSGTAAYRVEFEVKYESQVLLMAPYPNPSPTVFRFELSISGQTPPDLLQMQVITATGTVVKSFEATGFHIGTNQIVWDGTDHGMHEVPSGLYIYQLVITQDGQAVPIVLPEGESFFKGGYGKLLLRR
jgi:hypothetical protein